MNLTTLNKINSLNDEITLVKEQIETMYQNKNIKAIIIEYEKEIGDNIVQRLEFNENDNRSKLSTITSFILKQMETYLHTITKQFNEL